MSTHAVAQHVNADDTERQHPEPLDSSAHGIDTLANSVDEHDHEHKATPPRSDSSLSDSKEGRAAAHNGTDSSTSTIVAEEGAQGVARAEAFTRLLRQSGSGRAMLWLLGICLGLSMFAYALDQGLTTDVFSVYAASAFRVHSQISAVSSAKGIITAVSKPFIGKLADLTSRPTVYTVVLIFYVIGFVVAAASSSWAGYVIGICFTAFSKSGLDLLSDIIVSDLTPLQWRQFFTAGLSSPFFITTYVGAKIGDALVPDHWRWGAGMFAIMMPALVGPVIVLLFYMQHKASKMGVVSMADTGIRRKGQESMYSGMTYFQIIKKSAIDIDAIGLLLLGFAFALILLPFSLAKNSKGGWSNPSMIAMIVVGFVLMLTFAAWEAWGAPIPMAPRRLLSNRAFLIALLIDILTQFASYIESLYFYSYVTVIKDWTNFQSIAFSGTVTVGLCFWGLMNGLLQRATHRFKAQMLFGGVCKVVAYAMLNEPGPIGTLSTARLSIALVLLGFGGMTVGGARIASQASVPHRDLATVIFSVSLWSSFGTSCGAAVASQIWQQYMPRYLARELPNESAALRKTLFGSITKAKAYPLDSPIRQGVIRAYRAVIGYHFTTAACMAVVPLVLTLFVPNYWLGEQHNLVQNKDLDGKPVRVILRRPAEAEDEPEFDRANATHWQTIKHYARKAWDA